MSALAPLGARPGFVGFERSDIQAVIYRQGQDAPVAPTAPQLSSTFTLRGRTERDNEPAVLGASLAKVIGQPMQLTMQLKVPAALTSLFAVLSDDDWIDVVLIRRAQQTHVFRGTIDEIRRTSQVGGTGTTTTTWTLVARDFQKVYENTSAFLNRYGAETVAGALASQWVTGNSAGNVAHTVRYILEGLIKITQSVGRNLWIAPPNMPGMSTSFPQAVVGDDTGYTDLPPRASVSPELLVLEGQVWDLAAGWSDPAFCEFYTDLRPKTSALPVATGAVAPLPNLTPSDTEMAWVLRDRPFPLVDPELALQGYKTGLASPWFSLPTVTVSEQHVAGIDVGRNGAERYNLFMVSPLLAQDQTNVLAMVNLPLWNPKDMAAHGVRRYDVVSRFSPGFQSATGAVVTSDACAKQMRLVARDFHCANPYWLNGTVAFGRGVPELRIGMRLVIDRGDPLRQETYYVEGVTHTFAPSQGLRTTAQVTRGYIGTDAAMLAMLTQLSQAFELPPLAAGAS